MDTPQNAVKYKDHPHTEYLSYSRAYKFITSKKDFIKTYILKERKAQKESNKFTIVHQLIQKYFQNKDGFMQYMTICKDKEIKNTLDEFVDFINLNYNKDLKECFEHKIFEHKLIHLDLQLLGYTDALSGDSIIEIKGESINSLKLKKLQYTLQQVIYTRIFSDMLSDKLKPNFYFISIPLTYPYEISRFNFPNIWVQDVNRLFFDKIYPEYMDYILTCKNLLGNDCFDTNKKPENRRETLNKLVDKGLLSIDFECTPTDFEYKNLQINSVSNNYKVDIYK